MSVFIIDNKSLHLAALALLFDELQPIVVDYRKIEFAVILPGDLVILSGGPSMPPQFHLPEFELELALIRDHAGPMIGICLGFELIAHAFGSPLRRLVQDRVNPVQLWPSGHHELVGRDSVVEVYEEHSWSMPRAQLPLCELATSVDGVEIFQHVTKPRYGLQFHPEKSDTAGQDILWTIMARFGNQYDRDAVASLVPPDFIEVF